MRVTSGDWPDVVSVPNWNTAGGTGVALVILSTGPRRSESRELDMTTVKAAGSSQPLRWRRRNDERFAGSRRSETASFRDTLGALPVPVRQEHSPEDRWTRNRPAAAFVAQLLANRFNIAATPRRRRADREEVDARYHDADPDSRPTASGSLVHRDI